MSKSNLFLILGLAAAVVCFVLAWMLGDAEGQALPYQKNGQCSGSYIQSGGSCVPQTSRSAPSIPKGAGQCPSGWQQSGNACVQMEKRR